MGNCFIQFTDNNGSKLNAFHPKEFSIDAGYSRKLSDRSGIGLKYIHSNLTSDGTGGDSYKARNAVAADIGYYYNVQNNNGWTFGAALSNLGSKISYTNNAEQKDFIPAPIGIGVAYSKILNDQNRIHLGLDINKLLVPTPPIAAHSAAMVSYRNKSVVNSWFFSLFAHGRKIHSLYLPALPYQNWADDFYEASDAASASSCSFGKNRL